MSILLSRGLIYRVLLFVIALWPLRAAACDDPVARLVSIEGQVQRSDCGTEPWCDAALFMPICDGQSVRTGADSRAAVQLAADESVLRLDQHTTLLIKATDQVSRGLLLELIEGAINLFSRTRRSLSIELPFMALAIKGTEFQARAFESRSRIDLFDGVVEASNSQGSLTLHAGQAALAVAGEAPRLMALVDPIDAVQWSFYYTPLIAALAVADADQAFADAVRDATRGDPVQALLKLDQIPAKQRRPSWHSVRAAILLTVGRVDTARAELDAAAAADPGNADVAALRAVIALTRGDAVGARQALDRRSANSAAAWLAESYLQQNAGQLREALTATRRALELQPNNALLVAREAELLLTEGRLGKAVARAEQSLAMAGGDVSLGHIVLGFALLAERRPQTAAVAFDRALSLDQGDPLPRLGLGLAAISQGRLQAGTEELEIAVALDPRRSLLRSYLGKAYFEQNRNALATDQLDIAIALDPLDPQPWSYSAPLLLSENRPVEALDALVRAVELNDNRAVLRSRALLEQDRAARYATMGSVFSELSFDQLALPAGTAATAQAPAEPGGHFLLADLYVEQPRREVARVSEYLQARLLSPASSRPVQPLLTQTRLTIPSGLGPANLSLFEYGSLFDQDGGRAWVSAAAGNHQSIGNELLFSFLQGPIAFSLGQYHYEDEGYRPNNDQQRDLISAFAQWDLTPFTSVQAEIGYSDLKRGDLGSYFLPDAFSPTLRGDLTTTSYRLGLRQRFGPQLVLLASLIDSHQQRESSVSFESGALPTPFGSIEQRIDVDQKVENDGLTAEFRWLWSQPMLTVDFGGGHYQVDARRDNQTTTRISSPLFPRPIVESPRVRYSNRSEHEKLYLYTGIRPWQQLRLDLGLSWEHFVDALLDREDQRTAFDPKLGLTWEPLSGTRLRAAAFRTLQRPMVTYQTIEPTQVAGFNQLFQDASGDQAKHVGLAFDQRFGSRLFLGAWYTRQRNDARSVNVTVTPITGETVIGERDFKTERNQATGYLYWAPIDRLALAAEFHRETLEEFDQEPALRVDTRTQRIPLTGSVFLRNGLSLVARATHVDQRLFPDPSNAPEVTDHSSFWNLDLGVYWRLQKRMGFLSLNVLNLLDDEFAYQDQDSNRPLFVPERTFALQASLKFD